MQSKRRGAKPLTGIARQGLTRPFFSAARRARAYVLKQYPHVLGVTVDGSVGRGHPSPFSDVDVLVITKRGKPPESISYFDNGVYVSVGFRTLSNFKNQIKDFREFYWARGGASSARILHDRTGQIRRLIKARSKAKPTHKIEESTLWNAYSNIIEYEGKLRNGWLDKDEYLTRYAARIIASYSENAVIALNDLSPISENVVWHQVLKAKKKPEHFTTDYPTSLGIRGVARTSVVYKSALRLADETLHLIKTEFQNKVKSARFQELLSEPLRSI